MSGQDWIEKDFYAVLGVDKKADDAAIKKAYRKLARKWHPDQNPGDAKAEERFKEIGEAYAVLSDKQQRQQYDAIRAMAGGGARFSAGPGGGASGFDDMFGGFFGHGGGGGFRTAGGPGAGGPDINDILGGLFGGGGNFAQSSGFGANPFGAGGYGGGAAFGHGGASTPPPAPTRGGDLKASTTLSFRKALQGATVKMTIAGRQLSARVPAGVRDGQVLRLPGKGKAGLHGGATGDVLLTVNVRPDEVFTRVGRDLHIRVPVTVAEAALGAEVKVPTVDGNTLNVTVAPGSTTGDEIRVAGHGVSTKSWTGDLVVTLNVTLPRNYTDQQKAAIDNLVASFNQEGVRAELMTLAGIAQDVQTSEEGTMDREDGRHTDRSADQTPDQNSGV